MIFLSSNHFSVDDQIADVLSHLSNGTDQQQAQMADFTETFPEYNSLEWSGSWVDTEASRVDPEYMSWVADWIEQHTDVSWWEGEPVIFEDGDEDEDEDEDHSICTACANGLPHTAPVLPFSN